MLNFNLPFLKKKESTVIPGRGSVPVDRVKEMASRGFSEPEMIDVLRREGFSAEEIDKALTQSLHLGITGSQPQQQQQPEPQQQQPSQTSLPSMFPKAEDVSQFTPEPQQGSSFEIPQIPETSLPEEYSQYSTEDYVDYIIQNKMAEVVEQVGQLESKQKDLERKIEDLSKKAENMAKSRPTDAQEVSTKMENFADNVSSLESRVKSLEKAFKDTLPTLIEGVRSLSDVVQKIRKEG